MKKVHISKYHDELKKPTTGSKHDYGGSEVGITTMVAAVGYLPNFNISVELNTPPKQKKNIPLVPK